MFKQPTTPKINQLGDVPREVLENIFRFFNKRTFLRARAVSTEWYESSNFFWEIYYTEQWKIIHHVLPNEEKVDWKKLFLERNKILNFHNVNTRRNTIFSQNSDTKLNKGKKKFF
jgi:hypothetical protein